jgi:NAD(P)-dependent dehydrogenase (short-subunit alcohol dehydrogenase family)
MAKVWFVTGSSRGLGREIVEAALNAGDRVVATARKPEQLNDLVEKFRDHVVVLALDVTDSAEVAEAVAQGHQAFGRYDVVVNNAGYGDTASIEDTTIESFEKQIATNFLGVVYVTKAVLPILREQGAGHIMQVSSVGGRVGSPGLGAYQSAKWAVGGFSTVLAQEVVPLGIKVTVLEPGGMKTDWAGSSMTVPPVSAPYEKTVGAFAKLLRDSSGSEPTDPKKVAQVMLKLANEADVPVRLLLGTDAVQYAPAAAKALAESDAKWHDLSVSVAFTNAIRDIPNR